MHPAPMRHTLINTVSLIRLPPSLLPQPQTQFPPQPPTHMVAGTHPRISSLSLTNLAEEVAEWHEAAQTIEEIVAGNEMTSKAGLACVLCCLAVCLLLLLHTKHASSLGGGLHGCQPHGAREVCALKHAAGVVFSAPPVVAKGAACAAPQRC